MTNMKTSFDLIESFPEDLSSRVGYERLGEVFSKGSLAPGTLLMIRDEDWTEDTLKEKMEQLNELDGVQSVRPTGHPLVEDHFNVAKLAITFDGNPHGHEAMDTVEMLRDMSKEGDELYIAGETAKNVDIRDINERDTWLVVGLMTALIAIMLGFQTKSVIAPIYMVGSILYFITLIIVSMGFSLILEMMSDSGRTVRRERSSNPFTRVKIFFRTQFRYLALC
ncbi:MMPL family transporter [Savagea faecisuis]|uniref:MMPL family transporter n=1 Tax=Savagea faecisuis TaxID=1274803 RepID=A0ABW3GSH9_9BACL